MLRKTMALNNCNAFDHVGTFLLRRAHLAPSPVLKTPDFTLTLRLFLMRHVSFGGQKTAA